MVKTCPELYPKPGRDCWITMAEYFDDVVREELGEIGIEQYASIWHLPIRYAKSNYQSTGITATITASAPDRATIQRYTTQVRTKVEERTVRTFTHIQNRLNPTTKATATSDAALSCVDQAFCTAASFSSQGLSCADGSTQTACPVFCCMESKTRESNVPDIGHEALMTMQEQCEQHGVFGHRRTVSVVRRCGYCLGGKAR